MSRKKIVDEKVENKEENQEQKLSLSTTDDKTYPPTMIPCSFGQDAFIPYWDKIDGEMTYGIDKGIIKSICGCGDVWICGVELENGVKFTQLEPNIDVFFTQKEAERKLAGIKKTEDIKKLSKWRRVKQNV